MRRTALLLVTIVSVLATAVLAGDLTPPGAPASTMKTLEQAEPRTPISSLPFLITQPGSYYLTRNLALSNANTHGIRVQADNVTIDLNGFALIGAGNALGTSGTGINVEGDRYNLAIRNGTVRDWRGWGIRAVTGRNCQFESLRAFSNGNVGILAGPCSLVSGNTCYGNLAWGIGVTGPCTIINNTCVSNDEGIVVNAGSTITGNTCYLNAKDGIRCIERGNTITFNTCAYNTGNGISTSTVGNCSIANNTCSYNGNGGDGAGIYALGSGNCVEHNLVSQNDRGIDVDNTGNYIASNRASANTTNYDIVAGNTVAIGDLANVSF